MQSVRLIPVGARLFCGRCMVVPFETATAVIAIWAGGTSFFNLTISAAVVTATLPTGIVTLLNLMYLLSGCFILAGVGWNYRNLEATGIIFLFTSLLTRLIVLVAMAGFQPAILTAVLQNLTFGTACVLRLRFLLKRMAIAVVEVPAEQDA